MGDGVSLTKSRAQWEAALSSAIDTFRGLVAESSSKAWKPVPHGATAASHPPLTASNAGSLRGSPALGTATSSSTTARGQPKEQTLRPAKSISDLTARNGVPSSTFEGLGFPPDSTPDASLDPVQPTGPFLLRPLKAENIAVHKKAGKGRDVFRAVAEVSFEGQPDLVVFQSILQTPDARSLWDRLVDAGELIEQLDPSTRICKTNYRLGWPASPRDAITISRTWADDATLIDVSTSLPRSPDAPAYLRPAPPCVRSHVHLMAWCIQALPPSNRAAGSRIKITVFWSWDLKGAWMGMPTGGLGVQLPDLLRGLVKQVREAGSHVPTVLNYGSCVEVLSNAFDPSRDTRQTEYAVVLEDGAARDAEDRAEKDLDTLNAIRARRRLEAGVEFSLASSQGWDVQVDVQMQTRSSQASTWHATAQRSADAQRILLSIRHAKLQDPEEFVKVNVRLQRVEASTGLRLNDSPLDITLSEPRTAAALSKRILEDVASVSNLSVGTASTGGSASAHATLGAMANASRGGTPNPGSPSAINALIRRNYIYFTSLLQEPEAKWKPVMDTRGVTVVQLDSIDPTLVVYRAEATFVGVGVWDLFGTIANPGVQQYWDRSLEDATLLTDINELSSLWHLKTKPSWPVSARDAVTVQTAYKSAASVHVFSFSSDDRAQFAEIPQPAASTIRTQVDLRGWSIESLSPTTVHVTMLEQSDPKGWTSKAATPSSMVSAVAGVGEYAIKHGGPPVATRMLGAQAKISKYDHEKATFRIEYEAHDLGEDDLASAPNVECELRCDVETWCSSLDLVVDPPPISVSCLRRHRLSKGGGGLWLTIEHVAASLEDDLARITVRRGSSREKGSVFVNGAQMRVDVDELKGDQVEQLSKQKRSKPQRVPLDLNEVPRKAAPKAADSSASSVLDGEATAPLSEEQSDTKLPDSTSTLTLRPQREDETSLPTSNNFFSDERPRQPMTCALDVLFLLRRIHAERSPDPAGTPAGWSLVSERNGLYVRRKLMESISSTVFVQRGDKVVQGLSAEDLVDVVASLGCRSQWDDKVDSSTLLECYGNGANTSFVTTKASFPFRGRAFHLASLTARAAAPTFSTSPATSPEPNATGAASGPASVYFHASASFPEQKSKYAENLINPHGLPMGKVLIDGWILETLDPYASTQFQIPSTRCTHVVAVDYAGSLPVAVNTLWNSNLPRSILAIESFLKARGALPSVKTPPPCVRVLGDGRDEDRGLAWVLEDPSRRHLFLSTTFDPSSRTFTALSMSKSESCAGAGTGTALQVSEHPRTHSVSDASTTKAAALRAMSTLSPSATLPNLAQEGGVGLSRATSMNSITSNSTSSPSVLRGRPSAIRVDSRRATDMLLMEVEIELRHFSKGYDVQVFSEFLPVRSAASPASPTIPDETPGASSDKKRPVALSMAVEPKQDLPIQIKIFDLPPSAVLAATLDPSARPRKHLIRASLPTTAFLNPIEDPLTGQKPPEIPGWYSRLQEGGAVLRLVVKPLNPHALTEATATPNGLATLFSTPTGKVPVKSGSEKLEVTHVNQTSAMLQREQIGSEPLAQLRRAALPAGSAKVDENGDDTTRLPPSLLRKPLVADLDLLKADAAGNMVRANGNAPSSSTAVAGKDGKDQDATDKTDTGAASASEEGKTAAASSETKTSKVKKAANSTDNASSSAPASAGAQLLHIFNSYPLSRLGTGSALASSLTSVSSVTAKGSSVASTSSFKSNAQALTSRAGNGSGSGASSKPEASSTTAPSTSTGPDSASIKPSTSTNSLTATVQENVSAAAAKLSAVAARQRFSSISVVMIALIVFLLGSLVRSLYTPMDYVLVSSPGGVGSRLALRPQPVSAQPQQNEASTLSTQTSSEGTHDGELDRATQEVERYLSALKERLGIEPSHRQQTQAQNGQAREREQRQDVAWHEIRRLVEVKRLWGSWTLVLAVVRGR